MVSPIFSSSNNQYQTYYGKNYSAVPSKDSYGGIVSNKPPSSPNFGMTTTNYIQQNSASTNLSFTSSEEEALKDFYKKENTYVQDWGSIPGTIASLALFQETQNMIHPFKALKAIKGTDKVFDLSKASVKKVWDAKPDLAQELYSELNVINRNARKSEGFFSGWFVKKADPKTVEWAEKLTKEALENGSDEALIRATEQLRTTRAFDGKIPALFRKVKNKLGIKTVEPLDPIAKVSSKTQEIEKAVSAQIKDRATIAEAVTNSASNSLKATLGPTLKSAFNKGLQESKGFILLSLIFNIGRIKTAYKEGGTSSAIKQTGQTTVKAFLDGLGWAVGRAAGGVVGAKVGATVGSAICPGVGTLVGGIIGFAGAAVGSILASKLSNFIIPVEEATKLEAEKAVKTDEGKQKLLTMITQKLQAGQEIDPLAVKAAEKLAQQYGVTT